MMALRNKNKDVLVNLDNVNDIYIIETIKEEKTISQIKLVATEKNGDRIVLGHYKDKGTAKKELERIYKLFEIRHDISC